MVSDFAQMLPSTKDYIQYVSKLEEDYSNALFAGISKSGGQLQLVQSAAGSVLTHMWKFGRTTPIVKSLH